ncbi:MAG TPA: hypothetical protein PKN64_14015, partial [Casimicrobium sp.]|nr:hypothetical protein [Casimicrobium sp.]
PRLCPVSFHATKRRQVVAYKVDVGHEFRTENVGADLAALVSGISSFDEATPSRRLQPEM